jgi:hypothetical protein
MAKLIAQYQDGEEMQLFALIKEAAAKTTSAGKPYLALTLADASGEISAGMRHQKTLPNCRLAKSSALKDSAKRIATGPRSRLKRFVWLVTMSRMIRCCSFRGLQKRRPN